METIVTRGEKKVIIGGGQPTVLIGERINPAGKKKLAESLKAGSMDVVREEAIKQVKAGADIIDVNVGLFGVDETTLLPLAVKTVMETVDLPLCIDTANPQALENALKIYSGKPMINSVSGEEKSLARVLPLVKQYNATVIGLAQDDEGIPKSAERRFQIAEKIVKRAEAAGISRDNLVIDCMAFAIGAEPASAVDVLNAIRRITTELGVNTTMGASNVSFGLPDRDSINNAWVAMAIGAGATCLIVDVAKVRSSVLAADLVMALDKRARRYVAAFRQRQAEAPKG
jgi:5-methyltetrahydrofolate--homocysteine methyltransferase